VSGHFNHGGDHLAWAGAELALNVLTGRERAQAVAHLQRCGRCRAQVDQLASASDELLRLLPDRQPPVGFTAQAARQLGQARKASRQPRSRLVLAAAAAIVVVIVVIVGGLTGWALRTAPGSSQATGASPSPLRSAALLTPGHQAAGKVFLHRGSPTWMFVTADLPAGDSPAEDGTVVCQLTDQAGQTITVGSFQLIGGDGYWGSPEPDQAASIVGARLVSTAGTVLATASVGRTR
jgi:anti-sigma factor RsiW